LILLGFLPARLIYPQACPIHKLIADYGVGCHDVLGGCGTPQIVSQTAGGVEIARIGFATMPVT
jgi:hypothetical protein